MQHIYYADDRFDDLALDTRSQWIGRGKVFKLVYGIQNILLDIIGIPLVCFDLYGIQTAHDGRLMHHIIYAQVRLDDLDRVLDFANVCTALPESSFCFNPRERNVCTYVYVVHSLQCLTL